MSESNQDESNDDAVKPASSQNSSQESSGGAASAMTGEETFSVFILKTTPQGMRGAETYLKNRKWDIGTATGMREALAYIIQKQPQFVLIPSDHTHKKVKMLPKLLAQAFSVKIIAYTESQSKHSLHSLQEMNMEYSLFPPVSGPAIERIVRKVLVDDERKAKEQALKATDGTAGSETVDENGKLVIQGTQGAKKEQSGWEQARAALSQLVASGDDESESNSGVIVQKGSKIEAHSEHQKGHGPGEAHSGEQGSVNSHSMAANQEGANNTPLDPIFSDNPENKNEYSSNWQGLDSDAKNSNQDPTKPSKPGVPIMEAGLGRKGKITPRYKRDGWATDPANDSVMVRGTQQALEESVTISHDANEYAELEKSTNAACIIIESEQFNGYLVAAMGKDKQIDDAFLALVRQKLTAFLKAHGEVIKDSDSMSIKVQEVEFEDWAMNQATFLRKSIHEGSEIAMAFFPSAQTSVHLEQSKSEKMLQMKLEDLQENAVVEFDLYIHMPENDKYILYTPQGGRFMSNQKDRLNQKGITHMHLRKDSAGQVKKYRAQNFLNEKIASYKTVAATANKKVS